MGYDGKYFLLKLWLWCFCWWLITWQRNVNVLVCQKYKFLSFWRFCSLKKCWFAKILKGLHSNDTNYWCCCCSSTCRTLMVTCTCLIRSLCRCFCEYCDMLHHGGTQIKAVGDVYCHNASTPFAKCIHCIDFFSVLLYFIVFLGV